MIGSILTIIFPSRRRSLGHILLATLAISALIFAQNVAAQPEITLGNDFGVGARAMGMGGAFIGVADDSTALHWNPAGLSQIKRMEFFGALSHEKVNMETEYFGESSSTFMSKTKPNSLGIVLPVPVYRGGLAFALGVNRLQSFDSRRKIEGLNKATEAEDPEFYELYIDELSKESGGIYSWDFGAAVDVAPGVSLGGTLRFFSGNYDLEHDLEAEDTKDIDSELAALRYRDVIDADYFGVEGKIGLLARLSQYISLGATIDVPLDFSADEYWFQDSEYFYDDGTDDFESDEGTWPYDISRPFRFGGGLAVRPAPGAIVAADILYTDWTQTEYSDPPSEDISNEDFIDDYRATAQFRVGGEYAIPNLGVCVRAGYIYDPSPYTPDWVEIETERQFITFGLGMMMEEVLSLDAAYMRGFWKQDSGFVTEDRTSNRVFLSVKYRF